VFEEFREVGIAGSIWKILNKNLCYKLNFAEKSVSLKLGIFHLQNVLLTRLSVFRTQNGNESNSSSQDLGNDAVLTIVFI
jgi:hypothetical protein